MDAFVGIIWDVTKCLCGCLAQHAAYVYNLERNLRLLEDKWKYVKEMKQEIEINIEEAENTGHLQRAQRVHGWLLRIQDIQMEVEHTIVNGAQEIQDKSICEWCSKNWVSSYKLGKNVAKLLKNVNKLVIEGKDFCKNVEIVHKLPDTSMEMPVDETVGLDLMLDKVRNSIEEEDVGVIGLYGMGGAGKTTLLRKINNQFDNRRSSFDIVMWVVVSRELNFDSIMDNISKFIGIKDDIWNKCSNKDEKAARIYRVLKRMKFLLLLDDIWEQVDLRMVGVPNPKDTNFQSKVLFTTRSKDVCYKMQAQRRFKVECLMEKEAFELFCMKVGEETLQSHPDIPNLARDMAERILNYEKNL